MADSLQQNLLDAIQSSFPVERDPYAALAQRFDTTRETAKNAVWALCLSGSVRRIGASFDSRKLGYTATLCALAVPGGRAELMHAAEVVTAFPGVTHNYGRNHRYNLWFTLITRSDEEKTQVLDIVRARTGCNDLLDMPALRKFKISVDFGRQRAEMGAAKSAVVQLPPSDQKPTGTNARLFDADDPFDVELVRWAQDDIVRDGHGEFIDDPFGDGAAAIGTALGRAVDVDEVLSRVVELRETGAIRRFGAMVRHQRIGFAHNSMTVWDIPDEEVDAAGKLFAGMPFVSHCYTRARKDTWPLNLYAMTHATSEEQMHSNVESLAEALEQAGITCREHFALETTEEFKKVSMTYFTRTHMPFTSEYLRSAV